MGTYTAAPILQPVTAFECAAGSSIQSAARDVVAIRGRLPNRRVILLFNGLVMDVRQGDTEVDVIADYSKQLERSAAAAHALRNWSGE